MYNRESVSRRDPWLQVGGQQSQNISFYQASSCLGLGMKMILSLKVMAGPSPRLLVFINIHEVCCVHRHIKADSYHECVAQSRMGHQQHPNQQTTDVLEAIEGYI